MSWNGKANSEANIDYGFATVFLFFLNISNEQEIDVWHCLYLP